MPVDALSIACQRVEYVAGLMTHSPLEPMVAVTFGSYSHVWMLRPPTALFITVTLLLKYGANWLPHPMGQADAFIIVESPASQIVTLPAAVVVAALVGGALVAGAVVGGPVVAARVVVAGVVDAGVL